MHKYPIPPAYSKRSLPFNVTYQQVIAKTIRQLSKAVGA